LDLRGEGVSEKLILCFVLIRLQGGIENSLEAGRIYLGNMRHLSWVLRGDKKLACVGETESEVKVGRKLRKNCPCHLACHD
jgi:hypothetical protein